jgi:hypothetical protein
MTLIKFTGPQEKIKLNFRKLPTPMVEWEGTAKELHDLIMKAWVESDPEPVAQESTE